MSEEEVNIKEAAINLIKALKKDGTLLNEEHGLWRDERELLNNVLEKYGFRIVVFYDDGANPSWLTIIHKDLINIEDEEWSSVAKTIYAEHKAYEKLLNMFICIEYDGYDPNIIDEECRDKKYVEYIIEIFKKEGILTDEDIENIERERR